MMAAKRLNHPWPTLKLLWLEGVWNVWKYSKWTSWSFEPNMLLNHCNHSQYICTKEFVFFAKFICHLGIVLMNLLWKWSCLRLNCYVFEGLINMIFIYAYFFFYLHYKSCQNTFENCLNVFRHYLYSILIFYRNWIHLFLLKLI